MTVHTIYHIPGVKVGCTANFDRRRTEYAAGTVIEVIEQLHDKTDREAGDIEWDWADKFGYPRGHHYGSFDFSELGRKGGQKGGRMTAETHSREWFIEHARKRGHISGAGYVDRTTPEERVDNARRAALRQKEVISSDQLAMIARKGGQRSVELHVGVHARSADQMILDARKGAARVLELGLSGTQKRAVCLHCGLETNLASLARWHNDRCKNRKLLPGEAVAELPEAYR